MNMKEYCDYISHINYKIKCCEPTINNFSEINKDKYDHTKIIKDKSELEELKNFLILKQQEGITFEKTIEAKNQNTR